MPASKILIIFYVAGCSQHWLQNLCDVTRGYYSLSNLDEITRSVMESIMFFYDIIKRVYLKTFNKHNCSYLVGVKYFRTSPHFILSTPLSEKSLPETVPLCTKKIPISNSFFSQKKRIFPLQTTSWRKWSDTHVAEGKI